MNGVVSDWLTDLRAELKRASDDDASRRVRCPVCQAMTRDPERHEALHAGGAS